MSATKPKKSASPRRNAARAAVPGPVLEPEAVAAANDIDGIDDLMGELAAPASDALDDILGEIAPPAAEAAAAIDDFDDILSEITGPADTAPADDFDELLGQIAGPANAEPFESLDDVLNDLDAAPPAAVEAVEKKSSRKRMAPAAPAEQDEAATDDLDAMLDQVAAQPAGEQSAPAVPQKKRAGIGKRLRALIPNLEGTREISRKRYVLTNGLVAVLGVAVIGEAAVLLTRPAPVPAPARQTVAVTVVPVDYSKVDLKRYVGKVRALPEGGRDMLRHPEVKSAVVALEGGETLYKELRKLAARSPLADRMDIRDDRVTIASCAGPACTEKSFKLVYDIRHEHAWVCMTRKYINGAMLSYRQGPDGYTEVPRC